MSMHGVRASRHVVVLGATSKGKARSRSSLGVHYTYLTASRANNSGQATNFGAPYA
jgi:hypothetical protein